MPGKPLAAPLANERPESDSWETRRSIWRIKSFNTDKVHQTAQLVPLYELLLERFSDLPLNKNPERQEVEQEGLTKSRGPCEQHYVVDTTSHRFLLINCHF